MDLTDKNVLITGASSGIGRALALEFSRAGARVALLARRTERLEEVVSQLKSTGKDALAFTADVTKEADIAAAVAQVKAKWGHLDIVVANAGFGVAGNFERLTDEDYQRQFDINLFGVIRTLRATLPALKESRGVFAAVGSVMGFISMPGQSPYGMSKFAVRAFCQSLRGELAPHGVSVVHIAPGFISTEIRQVNNLGKHLAGNPDPIPARLRLSAEAAAVQIVRGIARRRREIVITKVGKILVRLVGYCPGLVGWAMLRFKVKGRPEPK